MSRGFRTLKDRMLDRLMAAGTWASGPELAEGLSTSQPAIEDALADLVLEEVAEYQPAAGYRLRASVLCRNAVRRVRGGRIGRAVEGQQFGDVYRLGVAEHRDGLGIVAYELELPLPPDTPDFLDKFQEQINAILKFTTRGIPDGRTDL